MISITFRCFYQSGNLCRCRLTELDFLDCCMNLIAFLFYMVVSIICWCLHAIWSQSLKNTVWIFILYLTSKFDCEKWRFSNDHQSKWVNTTSMQSYSSSSTDELYMLAFSKHVIQLNFLISKMMKHYFSIKL